MNRIVIALALVAAVGCSKDKDKADKTDKPGTTVDPDKQPDRPADVAVADDPAPPSTDDTGLGHCQLDLAGDVQKSIKLPAQSGAAGTDYWTKPESLEMTVKMLAGDDPAKQKEALASDPKFFTLLLNCTGENVSLSFVPGADTKYADVPFGPKKYALKGGAEAKAGEYAIMFVYEDGVFELAGDGGFLEVTKFDTTGIQGKFAFDAKTAMGEQKLNLKVTGSFDYKCSGDACTK